LESSHDGTQLTSISDDKTIKLWDVTTGELRKTLTGHFSPVNAVEFSQDDSQLESSSRDKTMKLWDPTTGELRKTLASHSSGVTAVAFSQDGLGLASASRDKTIKLWDPTTGEKETVQEVNWDISGRELAHRKYVSPLLWRWRDRSDGGRIYLYDGTRQAHS
jgi:WD40 repeat protein